MSNVMMGAKRLLVPIILSCFIYNSAGLTATFTKTVTVIGTSNTTTDVIAIGGQCAVTSVAQGSLGFALQEVDRRGYRCRTPVDIVNIPLGHWTLYYSKYYYTLHYENSIIMHGI